MQISNSEQKGSMGFMQPYERCFMLSIFSFFFLRLFSFSHFGKTSCVKKYLKRGGVPHVHRHHMQSRPKSLLLLVVCFS